MFFKQESPEMDDFEKKKKTLVVKKNTPLLCYLCYINHEFKNIVCFLKMVPSATWLLKD